MVRICEHDCAQSECYECEHSNRVYREWRQRELAKTSAFDQSIGHIDIVKILKDRYAESTGCSGGPVIDCVSRAAYEEIEKLRRQIAEKAGF